MGLALKETHIEWQLIPTSNCAAKRAETLKRVRRKRGIVCRLPFGEVDNVANSSSLDLILIRRLVLVD